MLIPSLLSKASRTCMIYKYSPEKMKNFASRTIQCAQTYYPSYSSAIPQIHN